MTALQTDLGFPAHGLPLGVTLLRGYFDAAGQADLIAAIRDVARAAPLYQPVMPRTGKPFSVRMTNCGALGWVADRDGYRYQPTHPVTGTPWPPIPDVLLDLWDAVADFPHPPEACLVNWYAPEAKLGLHQDRDEREFDAPVVSVSLGQPCRFRIGGESRKDPTTSLVLHSGDVLVFGGPARLAFHGVDRILKGDHAPLDAPGRINLTLRRVTAP